MQPKEHIVPLCLPPEIRVGIIKFQAENELSEIYSCQLLITKQLYQLKKISKEVYEYYTAQFSRKLRSERQPKPLTPTEQAAKQKQDELTRKFRLVIDDWNYDHKPQNLNGKMVSWKEYWLAQAEQNKDNPGAQELIRKYVEKQT
jgi:hypothetical protein